MRRTEKIYKTLLPILIISLIVLLIVGILLSINERQNSLSYETDQMVEHAIDLRERGHADTALQQLLLYCSQRPGNTDGYLLLGDWYMEEKETSLAYEAYKNAAINMECEEQEIGESDPIKRIPDFYSDVTITIYPNSRYTKDMTLTISGENLVPTTIMDGVVNGKKFPLYPEEGIITTDWFTIDSDRQILKLITDTRGSIWQFMDAKGNIISYDKESGLRNLDKVNFTTPSYSYVEIPKNAVKARVSYSATGGRDLVITYGKDLIGYTQTGTQTYPIPDLKEGQYISYADGKWTFYDGELSTPLDWKAPVLTKGSFYSVSGALCGAVKISGSKDGISVGDRTLQYGIRYSNGNGLTLCERLGDAKGMSFNYVIGDTWAQEGRNDFDNAYPWCDMKLCNIRINEDGSQSIIYEDDPSFATDGSNGNVMVQIPKFYTKRTVKNGYEEIWISGTKHEGYVLDYVFEGKNGKELDYVYVGAYIGAQEGNKIVSAGGKYPVLGLNYEDTLQLADNNGSGYSEMNYLLCTALQKLFVVETGTLDSSSLFEGETNLLFYIETKTKEGSVVAMKDATNTNTITFNNNYNANRVTVGSSIVIMENNWDNYNDATAIRREVVEITKDDLYVYITFDGAPIDIHKGKTVISNVPSLTGKTDSLDYCTGSLEKTDGKVVFKYRNIENLYGSALIMLDDDAYVVNRIFHYYDGNGNLNTLSTPIATQDYDLTNFNHVNTVCCINKMTYDNAHPLIMLPSVSGEGANVYNYYGDFWQYSDTTYPKYLIYGGTYDNLRIAGVFHMRAVLTPKWATYFSSARIMYR